MISNNSVQYFVINTFLFLSCVTTQCLECEGLFCPQKFVCHSHDPKNRTCHWGFDSENWRAYLHLAEDYTDLEREKLAKIVADFKNRYQAKPTAANSLTNPLASAKRKTVRHHQVQIKNFFQQLHTFIKT